MKYLVQAILIDGAIETVVNSLKTDDYTAAVETLMKLHKHSTHYTYAAIELETQSLVFSTTKNKFGW